VPWRGANGLCLYPEGNKLYCYDIAGPRWYIAVLDCYTDSVIKEIDGHRRPAISSTSGTGVCSAFKMTG